MSTKLVFNPLSGMLCYSAPKNLIFDIHANLWIVNGKKKFCLGRDLYLHNEF